MQANDRDSPDRPQPIGAELWQVSGGDPFRNIEDPGAANQT